MKYYKEIFFTLINKVNTNKSNDSYFVIFLFKYNLEVSFCEVNTIDELLKKIKETASNKKISKLFIPNDLEPDIIKNIYQLCNCTIYLNSYNYRPIPSYIEFYDRSLKAVKKIQQIDDIKEICYRENDFNTFFNSLLEDGDSETKIIKQLLLEEVLKEDQNGKVVLSSAGELIFKKESNLNRQIDVLDEEVNNHYVYSGHHYFYSSLSSLRNKVSQFIYNLLPKIQTRKEIYSSIDKPISLELISSLIDIVLVSHDFNSKKGIEVEVSSIGISVTYIEKFNPIIKSFFKKYFNMCSTDELYKRFESLNLFIDKYSKYDETTIKILFDNTINRTTTLLDPIEYAIIDIANRNDYFKRSIVDQKLKISPRTSNKYLNKLVDQGIIYKEGIGKEVLYHKVKK